MRRITAVASPRRPRSRWMMVVLALPVLVGGAYFALRSHEPRYAGKTSAQWFEEFRTASTKYWRPTPASPSLRLLDDSALSQDPAAKGLRALGTNAAVYLAREYERKEGILIGSYRRLYPRLPLLIKKISPALPAARWNARSEISGALRALGRDAAPAAPALIRTLPNTDAYTRTMTLGLLEHLSFPKQSLHPVLEEWSLRGDDANVLTTVSRLDVHTPAAARCLVRVLGRPDPKLRESALEELGKCGPEAADALPELTAALHDTNENIRYSAARALEAVGPRASAATTALLQATNDPSTMVQRAASRALTAVQDKSSH